MLNRRVDGRNAEYGRSLCCTVAGHSWARRGLEATWYAEPWVSEHFHGASLLAVTRSTSCVRSPPASIRRCCAMASLKGCTAPCVGNGMRIRERCPATRPLDRPPAHPPQQRCVNLLHGHSQSGSTQIGRSFGHRVHVHHIIACSPLSHRLSLVGCRSRALAAALSRLGGPGSSPAWVRICI